MAIRVSGLNSGLDTDSIVEALVSAYSTKKTKYEKALQKQEWTMDAWKETNSKVYSFYSTSLSNMRYSSSYNVRKSSVSDPTVANVTASNNVPIGTQSLSVQQLATSGYLTGAKLTNEDGATYSADTTLSELGISSGSLVLNDTTIELTGDMTMSGLASAMKEAGVNANYDATNGRFFISSKASGEENEFSLTAGDSNGLTALKALGLYVASDTTTYSAVANMTDEEKTAAIEKSYLTNYKEAIQAKIDAANEAIKEATANRTALAEVTAKIEAMTAEDYDYTTVYSDDEDMTAEGAQTAQEKYEAALAELQSRQEELSATDYDAAIAEQEQIVSDNEAILELSDEDLLALTSTDSEAQTIYDEATASVEAQIAAATEALSDTSYSSGATRVVAQNSIIYLNGAQFTASSNNYSINGMTLTVTAKTNVSFDDDGNLVDNKAVTITNSLDTQGIYDKIRDFLSSYNEMVKHIDTLYYADSAKGYEPLTDEEKEALTDSEVEKWEEKIKKALLRKNSTLSDISNAMKSVFLNAKYEAEDGTSYNLSSFGIATSNYFSTASAERGMFHIDGDSEDATTSANSDKLMAAIANDPDAVVGFFQNLSTTLYNTLSDKMAGSSLSSAFTIYNDKQMSSQYSDYQDKIDKWEERLTAYEDYYYSKFAAMETALSKLNSTSSSLSNIM